MFSVSSTNFHAGTPCWEWTGRLTGKGYGQMWDSDKQTTVMAHRFSHEYYVGPIPTGLQIDHLCRNKMCVNPTHIEAVYPRTNTLRGTAISVKFAIATHCIHGHPLFGENLYQTKTRRTCKECSRRRAREWYRAKHRV